MSGTRTISIRLEDEGVRHFNVDNIAYLKIMESEPTLLSVGLYMGIPLVIAVVTFFVSSWPLAVTVGVVLFFVILFVLSVMDRTEIGTLNDTYELEMDDVDDIEERFRQASQELITVEGTQKDAYNTYEYRYHLIPDNVVSVSFEPGRSIPVPYIFYGLAFFFGAPVASTESSAIGITGFVLFLAAGIYSSEYRRPDKVGVDFQNNETESFRMSPTDRRRFINEFNTRTQSQDTVRGEPVDSPGP